MPPISPGATATGSAWCFVRPWVDPWLAGGLSLVVFAGVLVFGPSEVPVSIYALGGIVQWVINWPHFSATNYRLLGKAENRREFPVTAYGVPWVVLAAVVASLRWPHEIAPSFVKFFMLWSAYHFSAQSLGISLLYCRRAGYGIGPWERKALSAFIYGAFLTSAARAETAASNASYYGLSYSGLGVPEWLSSAILVPMYLGAVVFLASVVRRYSRSGELPPYILAIVVAAQFVWFVVGYHAPAFYLFVPAFHSLQYLLIAWVMEMRESTGKASAGVATARWYGLNVIGGAALFWGLPQVIHQWGVPIDLATAVLIAGVQVHHFFVDGVIWKLRNPKVANPLTVAWPVSSAPGKVAA